MSEPPVSVAEEPLPGGWTGLVLRTELAEAVVLGEKGADILSLIDRRTGVDVLWKSPWSMPPKAQGRWNAEDEAEWLERYPGGWQVLCPNGGAAAEAVPGGPVWGFHGEASRIPWTVSEQSSDSQTAQVRLSTRLTRAPLRLSRHIVLDGARLTIEESVTTTGPDPIEIMWSHHPAFGAPLIGPSTRIATGARSVTADDLAPGTDLVPGAWSDWPLAAAANGAEVDLSRLPPAGEPRATFAYLHDFEDAWCTISNADLDLGVALTWDRELFPYAWFWQELNATPGPPWWRQAYVTAIEPATTIPGQGIAAARDQGARLCSLAAEETTTTRIDAVLYQPGSEEPR